MLLSFLSLSLYDDMIMIFYAIDAACMCVCVSLAKVCVCVCAKTETDRQTWRYIERVSA